MATRAEILNGADFEGWEDFCAEVINAIKNHYRVSNPVVNMVSRQPGEILSDPDDDKLYHVGGASGYPCDEILQASRSCDVIPDFKGVDFYDVCNGNYATIRGIDEPGLGHRLTVGLDETARTMVICDLSDIDVDFGLAAVAHPNLYIYHTNASTHIEINYNTILTTSSTLNILYLSRLIVEMQGNLTAGNAITFGSAINRGLFDTNAEQAWIFIEPEIHQTLTAGYIAILIDVDEENLGDASDGAGYNALMDLRVAGDTKFGIQNDGKIMTNQMNICSGATPGTVNGELPIYDQDGTLMGYIAIYDSICP